MLANCRTVWGCRFGSFVCALALALLGACREPAVPRTATLEPEGPPRNPLVMPPDIELPPPQTEPTSSIVEEPHRPLEPPSIGIVEPSPPPMRAPPPRPAARPAATPEARQLCTVRGLRPSSVHLTFDLTAITSPDPDLAFGVFLADVVSPSFPAGFTVLDGTFLSPAAEPPGTPARPAKLVVVAAPLTARTDVRLAAIATEFAARFGGEVDIVEISACMSTAARQ